MPAITVRSCCISGFCLWLIAAANAPAMARAPLKLRNAQVEPLSFSVLDGWKDDDHAAAFDAFLKSCGAILGGTNAMRTARPFYGALFKVCERAVAAGRLDRDHARAFFEENFKPIRVMPAGQTEGFFYRLLRNRSGWLALSERRIHNPCLCRAGRHGEKTPK